jgi:hypothetical protein
MEIHVFPECLDDRDDVNGNLGWSMAICTKRLILAVWNIIAREDDF